MYVREVISPRKRWPDARYLQLVEGERTHRAASRRASSTPSGLWKAERAFRSMKSLFDLEPVQHRITERNTAHAHLCVLAHLLTPLAENRSQVGWEHIRERVERITLTELTTDRASVLQTKTLTKPEPDFFNCCSVSQPPKILQVATT